MMFLIFVLCSVVLQTQHSKLYGGRCFLGFLDSLFELCLPNTQKSIQRRRKATVYDECQPVPRHYKFWMKTARSYESFFYT